MPFATVTGKSNVKVLSLASVSSVAWLPQVGQIGLYFWNSVGAPRKSLPQGASDVVTPLYKALE